MNWEAIEATIFKKNLTRFSPAWGLYTVCALMGLVLVMDSGGHWIASNLIQSLQVLALITPCYALICAQLLFGDLYNSRMCNALHALPMKRETWFVTNVLSGFVFHLIPTAIMAVLAAILLLLVGPADNIPAAGIWFAGVNLQFMCFFGIAVFCVFCVGSRFAQAVVYGIVNFGALILGWLLELLYVPQFYGIRLDFTPFFNFCPCGKMMEAEFVRCTRLFEDLHGTSWVRYYLGEAFAYYFIVAAVGIALLFAALHLYRRRNLECAGDFMAIKGLEPVFQVVFSLMAGAVFYFFTDQIIGINTLFFLFAGLAVGWFVGKMLLERTPRVFRLKSFLRCGALMAIFGLTLVVASLDIFGIVRWVPEADQVESVGLSNYWYSPYNLHEDITLTDPADIQQVIDMHQEAVDFYEQYGRSQFRIETVTAESAYIKEDAERMDFSLSMTIHYHMKSGRTVSRHYAIWMGDDTGDFLRQVFSRPETVFGSDMTEERFLEENSLLLLRDTWDGEEIYVHDPADLRDLYRAIIADCEAGTMAQIWDFHHPDESLYWINRSAGEAITIFSNAENTLNWLRAYGADVDALLEKYGR